jgi:ectoine hydroxylase-related dioxygenase (phytanoyl-CoA dioxygenase family)
MVGVWREQWVKEGYLVVPGIFEPERVKKLLAISDDIHEQWIKCDAQTGKPSDNPDATSMRHLNHSDYFLDRPETHFTELMDAVADELVLGICRAILGETPLFRCTTYWFNPTKTGQDGNWHRDTQFGAKSEDDERAKLEKAFRESANGIQMQIALVPSADVEYVPRSHLRLDTPDEHYIRRADNFEHSRSNEMPGALRIPLQPGDAAIFNANGLHRGRYHTDKLRRTLMFTYTKASMPFFDYFSDQPWFLRPGHLAPLSARTRAFFEPFVAEYRGKWKPEVREMQTA